MCRGNPSGTPRKQEVRMENGKPDWGFWSFLIALYEMAVSAMT